MNDHLIKFQSEQMREIVQVMLLAGSIIAGLIALIAMVLL